MTASTIATALVAVVTVLYIIIAVTYCLANKPAMGIVFGGYAVANVALLYQGMK